MNEDVPIEFDSELCRKSFAALGLNDARAFWNLRADDIDCESRLLRDICSFGGRHRYSTLYIKLNKSRYRLKRAGGRYFDKLMGELKVLKHLPDLHITPPQVAAKAVDEKARQCIVLFKYPPGYIVLKNLLEYNLPPPIIADFEIRRKKVMENIARALKKMQYCDFYYPYWTADNIAVKNKSDSFSVVDVEDFRHIKYCPIYYRLPLISWLIRKAEWRTLRKNLASGIYTSRYMRKVFQNA